MIWDKCKRIEDMIFKSQLCEDTFCCIDDKGEWHIGDLRKGINNLCNVLKDKPGNTIAVIGENSAGLIMAIMSVLKIGRTVLLIDPQMPISTIEQLMNQANVVTACLYGAYAETLQFTQKYNLLYESKGDWKTDSFEAILCKGNMSSNAIILPTSGTTGRTKLVVLSHKAILTNIESIVSYMNCTKDDTFLIVKSIIHSSTLTGEILTAIAVGAKIILLNPKTATRVLLNRIRQYNASIMCVNPSILQLMCRTRMDSNEFKSLRVVYTSGAVANERVLRKAEEFFKSSSIFNVYGLTEAGPRVSAQRLNKNKKYGSVGFPLNNIKITILDDRGNVCKPQQIGEIYVDTPSVMNGYLNDEVATKEKIKNGIIRTGDLGYLDKDGELFVIGRCDDTMIVNGKNVNPSSVEKIVESYNDDIECIVFGVSDELYGDKIVCIISTESNNIFDRNKIFLHCKKNLALYECPHEIHIWKEIPRLPSGKVSRNYIKNQYLRNGCD